MQLYLVNINDVWETSQQVFVLSVCLHQEVQVFLRLKEVKGQKKSSENINLKMGLMFLLNSTSKQRQTTTNTKFEMDQKA